MELSFATKTLREICERHLRAVDEVGSKQAELLHDVIAELRAAPAVVDVSDWRSRMRPCKHRDRRNMLFGGSIEIEFKANHIRNPIDDDGNLVWEHVSSIKILRIEIKNAKKN